MLSVTGPGYPTAFEERKFYAQTDLAVNASWHSPICRHGQREYANRARGWRQPEQRRVYRHKQLEQRSPSSEPARAIPTAPPARHTLVANCRHLSMWITGSNPTMVGTTTGLSSYPVSMNGGTINFLFSMNGGADTLQGTLSYVTIGNAGQQTPSLNGTFTTVSTTGTTLGSLWGVGTTSAAGVHARYGIESYGQFDCRHHWRYDQRNALQWRRAPACLARARANYNRHARLRTAGAGRYAQTPFLQIVRILASSLVHDVPRLFLGTSFIFRTISLLPRCPDIPPAKPLLN